MERSGSGWRSRRPEAAEGERSGSRLPLLVHPESVVSRLRSEGHLGRTHPGCTGPVQRNTQSRGGGSVSSALYTYPRLVSVSPECFQCDPPLSQLGLLLHQVADQPICFSTYCWCVCVCLLKNIVEELF